MEIRPCSNLVWAGQILVLWVPVVLATCKDLNSPALNVGQRFLQIKIEMEINCEALLNREIDECSPDCDGKVQSMVQLYRSPIFFTCDCSDTVPSYSTDDCHKFQERLAMCPTLTENQGAGTATSPPRSTKASTTPTILKEGREPCTTARRRCLRNANCQQKLEDTVTACQGAGCGEACRESLNTFLAHHAAQNMWDCTGCGEHLQDDNTAWCDLSKRCTDAQSEGPVVTYRPEGTAKTPDKETNGGHSRKSVDPLENAGRPSRPALTWLLELLLLCVILSTALY